MLMEMCTTALGRTTRHTDLEFTAIWTEHAIRVSGKRTNNMARDSKHGLMGLATKDNMWRDASMVRVASHGLITAPTQVTSSRTTLKA